MNLLTILYSFFLFFYVNKAYVFQKRSTFDYFTNKFICNSNESCGYVKYKLNQINNTFNPSIEYFKWDASCDCSSGDYCTSREAINFTPYQIEHTVKAYCFLNQTLGYL